MLWYLLRRAGAALLVVFAASVVVFVALRLLPGGPAVTVLKLLSPIATGSDTAAIRAPV